MQSESVKVQVAAGGGKAAGRVQNNYISRRDLYMKKERTVRVGFAMLAVLGLCTVGAVSGCIRQTEVPIIAKKQETGHSDTASGQTEGAEAEYLIERLAQTPELYQADMKEEKISIQAKAPLVIPAVSRIPMVEIENSPYTAEDCQAVQTLLEPVTGAGGWNPDETFILSHEVDGKRALKPETYVMVADNENPGHGEFLYVEGESFIKSYHSADGNYRFSYVQGNSPNSSPLMWLSHLTYSDIPLEPDTLLMGAGKREALQTELEGKAEALLEEIRFGDYFLKSAQWKSISRLEEEAWLPTEQFGLRLTYVREYEGISTINRDVGWASDAMAPAQYVEFLYLEDGTLLRMKNVHRERVAAMLGDVDVLLPFDAVSQIFEQYMKYYQTATKAPHLSVEVTEVRFGYQLEYLDGWDVMEMSKGSGKGRLVPVWAFYGTPELGGGSDAGQTTAGEVKQGGLLVAVNAEDGTVYGKE